MMRIDEELALLREARDISNHIGALDLFPLSPDLGHSDDDGNHVSPNNHMMTNYNLVKNQSNLHQIHHHDNITINPHHLRIYSPIHTFPSHMPHKISVKHNPRVSPSSRSIAKKPDRVHTNPLRNRLHAVMADPTNAIEPRLSRDGRQLHEAFRKKLTSSDVSCQQDRLLMAKDRRGCLGMHNTPSPENRDVIVDMWDESDGRKYSFVHGLWTSNGSYVLKRKMEIFL